MATLLGGVSSTAFDLQGHRGARGLAPENTLAAFAKALQIGVTTLETDLAVTKDGVIVLSHSPRLNPDITRGPDGQWITEPILIQSLMAAELRRFDVGRIKPWTPYHAQFPTHVPADGSIPTLEDLFRLTQGSAKSPRFNIEIKTSPSAPDDAPPPQVFARMVIEAVRRLDMAQRTSIQSFDWSALLAAKRLAPEIETACLTSQSGSLDNIRAAGQHPSPWLAGFNLQDYAHSLPRLVKAAGCDTWLPYHGDLRAALVKEAHALGLKVIPWTINSRLNMNQAIDMEVDGLITDYPDRAREAMAERGVALP